MKYFRSGVVVAIFLAWAAASHAATFNINITGITNHTGGTLNVANATVTAYIGSPVNPDTAGAVSSMPLRFTDAANNDITANLRIVNGAIVFSGLSNQVAGGNSIYLRIWEDGSNKFSASSYYVDIPYTLKGTPTEDFIFNFDRNQYYCNYYPPTPTIAINSINPEKLSRAGLTTPAVYKLQLNYVITPGTAYRAVVSKYEVEVVKQASKGTPSVWPATKDNIAWFDDAGGSTPTNDFYVSGNWYYLRARGVNQLGPSDASTGWSSAAEYESATGGVSSGGGGTATFAIVAGMNTVSVPCDPASAITVTFKAGMAEEKTATVSAPATIGKLLTALNSAIGTNVSVVGFYDSARKQHVGIAGTKAFGKPSSTGPDYTVAEIEALPITQGQALQITVDQAGTLTLSQ